MRKAATIAALMLVASPAGAIDEFVVHEAAEARVVFSMEDVQGVVDAYWPGAKVVTAETIIVTMGLANPLRANIGDIVWRVNVAGPGIPAVHGDDGVVRASAQGALLFHDGTGKVVTESRTNHFPRPIPQPLGLRPPDTPTAMRIKRIDLPSMDNVPYVPKEQRIKRDLSRDLTPAPVPRSERKRQPDYLAPQVHDGPRITRHDLPGPASASPRATQRKRHPMQIAVEAQKAERAPERGR